VVDCGREFSTKRTPTIGALSLLFVELLHPFRRNVAVSFGCSSQVLTMHIVGSTVVGFGLSPLMFAILLSGSFWHLGPPSLTISRMRLAPFFLIDFYAVPIAAFPSTRHRTTTDLTSRTVSITIWHFVKLFDRLCFTALGTLLDITWAELTQFRAGMLLIIDGIMTGFAVRRDAIRALAGLNKLTKWFSLSTFGALLHNLVSTTESKVLVQAMSSCG